MMRARICVLLACGVALAACDRRDRLAAPDSATPPATAAPRSAYISVSDLTPEKGQSVTVAGTLVVDDSTSLGSFKVRLAFDSSRLRFIESVETPGMLRVVNPKGGEIIVVGATAGSSEDGRLFTLRFTVIDPSGLNSLALQIDELNDGSFSDQASSITRASKLRHDTALSRGAGGR